MYECKKHFARRCETKPTKVKKEIENILLVPNASQEEAKQMLSWSTPSQSTVDKSRDRNSRPNCWVEKWHLHHTSGQETMWLSKLLSDPSDYLNSSIRRPKTTVEQEATYAITPPVRVNSEGSISNLDRKKKPLKKLSVLR